MCTTIGTLVSITVPLHWLQTIGDPHSWRPDMMCVHPWFEDLACIRILLKLCHLHNKTSHSTVWRPMFSSVITESSIMQPKCKLYCFINVKHDLWQSLHSSFKSLKMLQMTLRACFFQNKWRFPKSVVSRSGCIKHQLTSSSTRRSTAVVIFVTCPSATQLNWNAVIWWK